MRHNDGFTSFLRSGSITYFTTFVIICQTQRYIGFCQLIPWLGESDLQDVHWRLWRYTGSAVFQPEVTLKDPKFQPKTNHSIFAVDTFFPVVDLQHQFTHHSFRISMGVFKYF